MTGGMKNCFDHHAKEPMKGDVVGLFALAGGAMAALNTLNNMSIVGRSLGAWVAPDYCALNSEEVKAGLDERALNRVEAVVTEVIDTARRLNLEGF
jgi:NAD(P)H-dependent FMN reductase